MPTGKENKVIAGCGVHHVAIQARDWEASLKLYRDVLGMPVVAQFGTPERKIVLLDIGDGSCIELFQPTASTPAPGSPAGNDPITHIAFTASDTRAATEHVRAAGYRITVEPRAVRLNALDVVISFFEGPNGEVIEFFQTM
jgi:catechol 2,3-dioxygenase-like lactoylglutathione lyase family enzyme